MSPSCHVPELSSTLRRLCPSGEQGQVQMSEQKQSCCPGHSPAAWPSKAGSRAGAIGRRPAPASPRRPRFLRTSTRLRLRGVQAGPSLATPALSLHGAPVPLFCSLLVSEHNAGRQDANLQAWLQARYAESSAQPILCPRLLGPKEI